MSDPAEDVPTDRQFRESNRDFELGALRLGMTRAVGIRTVVELTDQLHRSIQGMEVAIPMIADVHHASTDRTVTVKDVEFQQSEIRVRRPSVSHLAYLRDHEPSVDSQNQLGCYVSKSRNSSRLADHCSYLYRPRRKRAKRKFSAAFKVELQALAIRTGKIYLQTVPKLTRTGLQLFLDIESIPDEDFHYLIGLSVCSAGLVSHHSFWSDSPDGEHVIWLQFLEALQSYPNAPIYHYGAYDRRVIEKVSKRYELQCEDIVGRMVNVSSIIYGAIYFPVRSNSLKDLGKYIGATWTSPDASGLQSLVWRHLWEETHDPIWKQQLLTYNQEDCNALRLLSDRISTISEAANTMES